MVGLNDYFQMNVHVTLGALPGEYGEPNGSGPSTRITVTFHDTVRASAEMSACQSLITFQRVSFDQPTRLDDFPSRALYVSAI